MGPRASLNEVEKREIYAYAGNQTRILGRPVRSPLTIRLSCLSYGQTPVLHETKI